MDVFCVFILAREGKQEVARPAVKLVHGQKEKEEENKGKHILQKTPWVLRKLVRVLRQLQKL